MLPELELSTRSYIRVCPLLTPSYTSDAGGVTGQHFCASPCCLNLRSVHLHLFGPFKSPSQPQSSPSALSRSPPCPFLPADP